MPGSLQPISRQPSGKTDVRDLWFFLGPLFDLYNALLNFQIVTNSGRNRLTITAGNAVLELNITAAAAVAPTLEPWQPYAAPYTGGGDSPADWALNFMITPGNVQDGAQIWLPARRNIVITAPANCTTGFFVWLEATVSAAGLITALDYNYGTALPVGTTPTADATGTPPPTSYYLLMILTSSNTAVDLADANIQCNTPLSLLPVVTNQTNLTERRMQWSPPSPASNLGLT